jgi:ferric-dicitrate binding protein FerR (iron transport regulator)
MRVRVALLLGTVVALWCSGEATAQSGKDVAFLLKAKGTVQVSGGARGPWRPARAGQRLNSGYILRTGDRSLASVVFTDDKSMLKIRENSNVTIRGERKRGGIFKRLFLSAGQLWAKVSRQRGELVVETPSGVAAVKGTEFYLLLDEDGNMIVFTIDGLIELINRFGSVMVGEGQRGFSDGATPPTSEPAGDTPQWAQTDDEGSEVEIEFQDSDGNIKRLKIRLERP